jgi:AraC family transcriptional regulator
MHLQPRLEMLVGKSLGGKRLTMSFAENRTTELWRQFMPRRAGIPNPITTHLYSVEIFGDPHFFERFDTNRAFEKWAAIEVEDLDNIPDDLEGLRLPSGMYAVFIVHQGRICEKLTPLFFRLARQKTQA